ncbi:distal tail protein Dit [Lacticaseibacillus mingshuiensis]|uniref:distal tail protein Dit n=1 Tax=Lacticaseibacillus mingshuiensis TaxID=2799574 RepID=UPI0019410CA9|nr:distal tail protein Dit [Lacticaseibacillus mingshuiensis]
MAGISLIYNDVELSQWLDVTNVQRNVGTAHTNTMVKVGKSDGQLWQYMSRDAKTITVTGIITNANLANLRRELGAAIDTDEPQKLIIGDDTGVYYNAIYDGQPTLAEEWRAGTVSLSFIVPDGVAHSLTTTTATNGDGTDTISFNNNGSYKSYPVITATMSGDNGFLGLASSSGGYLEFGDAESPDKIYGTKSDRVLWWSYRSQPAGSSINTGCVTAYPYRLGDSKYPNAFDGSLKFGQGSSKEVATPAWASNSANVWHGPAIHGDIAANINGVRTGYFTFSNRVDFKPTKKGFGRVEFNLENNGQSGIAAILRDSGDKSASRNFDCVVGTLSSTVHSLKSYVIPASWKTFLEAKITRKGNTVTWQLAEINGKHSWHWSTTMAELGAMEITGVTIWPQKYSNAVDLDIELTDSKFVWQNETTVTDIPNLFADGDVVTIDTQSKKILVNGVEDRGLQEIGNHWDDFFLTPGNNTITVDGSSWATQPRVDIYYQEAYV